ncbi:MAG TPA: DUF4267 domain-containing protein [Polyangiaceae bacterium]
MGIGRILLGLAPFVAARASSRLLGFPAGHDNPTARLMARFFGVRDVGLGVLVFWALANQSALPFVLVFNALTDFGDLAAIVIPLARRHGIDRAALASAAFALPAGIGWLTVRALV